MKGKKLEPRGRRGILLRCLSHKNYRVWDMESRKVRNVRHVRFDEKIFPGRNRKVHAAQKIFDDWIEDQMKELKPESGASNEKVVRFEDHNGTITDFDPEITDLADGSPVVGDRGTNIHNPEPVMGDSGMGDSGPAMGDSGQTTGDILTYQPSIGYSGEEGPSPDPSSTDSGYRYPSRERLAPKRYGFKLTVTVADEEMKDVSLALTGPNPNLWREAIDSELEALREHKTWVAESPPAGKRTIDSRLLTVKHTADGSIDKFKARLVAKGFQQRTDGNVYAPVIYFTTVRLLMSLIVARNGHVHQMDVRTAFLNASLDDSEEVYMWPPKGIDIGICKGQVLRLRKAIYGLKKAPNIWNGK